MEKQEKIRKVHSKRTRTLILLSAAAFLSLLLGALLIEQPPPPPPQQLLLSHTHNDNDNTPLRQQHQQSPPPQQLRSSSVQQGMTQRRQQSPRALPYAEENLRGLGYLAGQQQQRRMIPPPQPPQQQPAPQQRAPQQPPAAEEESEQVLAARVAEYDQHVRQIKQKVDDRGGFMETDTEGVTAARALQQATRQLLHKRYGPVEPYRVKVDLEFQPSNPTYATDGPTDSFVIEMAPASLVPHSVFSFLEIARHWQGGAFHRRANHVLQVMVRSHQVPHLAFQEYSPQFPHVKGTVGYAGRPSGPAWYVSILDNTKNHGPGTQQQRNPHEADACFGKVVKGFDEVVLGRITQMPGQGFLQPPLHVKITQMTILVPAPDGTFVPWTGNDALASS